MKKTIPILMALLFFSLMAKSQTADVEGDFDYLIPFDPVLTSSTVISGCSQDITMTVTTDVEHTRSSSTRLVINPEDDDPLEVNVVVTFSSPVVNPALAIYDFDWDDDLNASAEIASNFSSEPNFNGPVSISPLDGFQLPTFMNDELYNNNTSDGRGAWVSWEGELTEISFTIDFVTDLWILYINEWRFDCVCDDVSMIPPQEICSDDPTSEVFDIWVNDGGEGGEWSSFAGTIADPFSSTTTITGLPEGGPHSLIWTDNCTGKSTASNIQINLIPDVTLVASPGETLCFGETGTVFAQTTGLVSQYIWDIGCDDNAEQFGGSSIDIPADHEGLICVSVIFENGCSTNESIYIKRDDCLCPDGLYHNIPDQIVCEDEFDFCISAPVGFTFLSASSDNINLVITDPNEVCVPVEGIYYFEFSSLAADCTALDTVNVDLDTTCCEIIADFQSSIFFGICNIYEFTNLSLPGSNTNILGYSWDFGNETFSTLEDPGIQLYSNEAMYQATLTVVGIDDQGRCCSSSISQTIDVDCPCGNVSNFSMDASACSVTLTDNSTASSGSTNHQWEWDMGNGTILFGETVNYTYPASGTYNIVLTTYAYDGNEICQSSSSQTFVANCGSEIPCDLDVDFSLILTTSVYQIFQDQSITGLGTTAMGYQWTIDGVLQNSTNPDLIIAPPLAQGNAYNICLTVFAESQGECCTVEDCQIFNFPLPGQGEGSSEEQSLKRETISELEGVVTLEIAPNPTAGKSTIHIQGVKSLNNWNLEIFSIDGQIIYSKETFDSELMNIDLSNYPAGLYLVKATNGQKNLVQQIVLE